MVIAISVVKWSQRKETTVAYHPSLESTSCDFAGLHGAIEQCKSTKNLLVSHEPHQIIFIDVSAPNPTTPNINRSD